MAITLNEIAAIDFRFFRAFVDGNDRMYEKFIKDCPTELEGLASIKTIVNSFKKNIVDKCNFVVICDSILPACNNITICREYFVENSEESKERKDFRKEWTTAYSETNYVMAYTDGIIYSNDENLTNEFLAYMLKNKLVHRLKKVKNKECIKNMLDIDFDFLKSIMDVNTTNKNPEIPWKHLPCLPVLIKDNEFYHTFDLSFVADEDGQTYLNLYDKEFKLVERPKYKKFEILEEKYYD
jgi:hypothetical protein